MTQRPPEAGSTFSGTLLVAGTCIGAGMLALPLVTGAGGFGPAMLANLLCWLFVLCTGLLLLEVNLWMDEGAHILSMTKRFLGRIGEVVGGGVFLFLYYCLMIAYLAGGGPLWGQMLEGFSGLAVHPLVALGSFATVFAFILFLGTKSIDRINWLLMAGLVLSYLLMLGVGSSEVNLSLLFGENSWALGAIALPTFFSAFGYHNIIPSITLYLHGDVKKLRRAIIIGSSVPFLVYSFWLALVMGTVPKEALEYAYLMGMPVSGVLSQFSEGVWMARLSVFFSFFALVTSLLGVSLSMVDFLGDGLGIKRREGLRRLGLVLLVFVPPGLLALNNPRIFFDALAYAGGFGEAVLNGLLPVLMVWIGRYKHGLDSAFRLPGGKPMLLFLLACTLGVIGLEIYHLLLR